MERDEKIKKDKIKYIIYSIERSSDVLDEVFSLCVKLKLCEISLKFLNRLAQINRTENESEE